MRFLCGRDHKKSHTALMGLYGGLMPEVGLEPTRAKAHWILSPARLPISPLRQKRF